MKFREVKALRLRHAGRSPCGERGLKSIFALFALLVDESLPVRGAWIEITICARHKARKSVAPRAGSVD